MFFAKILSILLTKKFFWFPDIKFFTEFWLCTNELYNVYSHHLIMRNQQLFLLSNFCQSFSFLSLYFISFWLNIWQACSLSIFMIYFFYPTSDIRCTYYLSICVIYFFLIRHPASVYMVSLHLYNLFFLSDIRHPVHILSFYLYNFFLSGLRHIWHLR